MGEKVSQVCGSWWACSETRFSPFCCSALHVKVDPCRRCSQALLFIWFVQGVAQTLWWGREGRETSGHFFLFSLCSVGISDSSCITSKVLMPSRCHSCLIPTASGLLLLSLCPCSFTGWLVVSWWPWNFSNLCNLFSTLNAFNVV